PDSYLEDFKKAGAAVLTVHYEACNHLHRTLQKIKSLDCKAGVAINPHTPVEVLKDIIIDVDMVCIMSVNPGFGGQSFIQRTYDKIRRLRQLIDKANSNAKIEVDGGVNEANAGLLLDAGADVLVAGSFVFSSHEPISTIQKLKEGN